MDLAPPDPSASPERQYEQARLYYAKYREKAAVVDGIKAYLKPWESDKRMRVMGQILMREIERLEMDAARA